jgi:hypothetical protein
MHLTISAPPAAAVNEDDTWGGLLEFFGSSNVERKVRLAPFAEHDVSLVNDSRRNTWPSVLRP